MFRARYAFALPSSNRATTNQSLQVLGQGGCPHKISALWVVSHPHPAHLWGRNSLFAQPAKPLRRTGRISLAMNVHCSPRALRAHPFQPGKKKPAKWRVSFKRIALNHYRLLAMVNTAVLEQFVVSSQSDLVRLVATPARENVKPASSLETPTEKSV